jgi:hypothetical protein
MLVMKMKALALILAFQNRNTRELNIFVTDLITN